MKTFEHSRADGLSISGYCKWLRYFPNVGRQYCLHKDAYTIWGVNRDILDEPGVRLEGTYCRTDYGRRKSCCEEGEL